MSKAGVGWHRRACGRACLHDKAKDLGTKGRVAIGGIGTTLIVAAGWHDAAPGGANKLPTDFARYLARRGRRVAYLCISKEVERSEPKIVDGVEIWGYQPPRGLSPSPTNLMGHLEASRRLTRRIAAHAPIEVVLGHSPLQYLGALTACTRRVRGCYAVHSPFVAELKANCEDPPRLRHRLSWRAARFIEKKIYQRSAVVHCDSAYTLGYIRTAYPRSVREKGIILPGWVDTDRFTPSREASGDVRQRLGPPWKSDAPTFFTLRRLVPRMGLDALVEAAAILSAKGRLFQLVIGGDGPQRTALEEKVRELHLDRTIVFLGCVSEETLVDSFCAADCFVLPTRTLECFGLIALEAYACGVPVIGVPIGSIPELMGAEMSVWIADDNSPAALAARMEEFLSGRLAIDKSSLRKRALEFRFERIVRQHEAILLNGSEG